VGLTMCMGGDAGELDALARWQSWQSRHHAATWEARPGQRKRLEINRLEALMPGWARLWMASKKGRRKLAGTSGLKTPEEVSTRMGKPFINTSDTRSEGEELARWQSGQAGYAAANAAKSTGGDGWLNLVVAAWTGDPEGAFTPVDLLSASPGLPMGAMRPPAGGLSRPIGGLGRGGPAVAEGTRDPEGTFTPIDPVTAAPGPQEAEAGLESVSATMFDSPVIWRITGVNSATKERWRCWRAEIGSDRLCRAPTRGL
jgi:hypothetical protein